MKQAAGPGRPPVSAPEPGRAGFEAHRPRLLQLAYRMLASVADAEDAVQETFIRWHNTDLAEIRDPAGWLIAACTRICIDELRSARRRRERYVGPWLPEPILDEAMPPDWALEQAQHLDLAFLVVLERLGPVERAIFLLHEVFEMPHRQVAELLKRSEAAVRQVLSRARKRLGRAASQAPVAEAERTRLASLFFEALKSGDAGRLAAILAEDAELVSDGGGKAIAARNVLRGRERLVRFLAGILRKQPAGMAAWPARVNGGPGLLVSLGGRVDSVFSLGFDGAGRISAIYAMRNPDKLARAAGALRG